MTGLMRSLLGAAMLMLTTASCSTPRATSTKVTEATFYSEDDIHWFHQVKTHPGAVCTMPDSVWNTTVTMANRMLKFDRHNERVAEARP